MLFNKESLTIFYLPVFYSLVLVINLLFNFYSTLTFFDTLILIGLFFLVCLFYVKIATFVLAFFCKKLIKKPLSAQASTLMIVNTVFKGSNIFSSLVFVCVCLLLINFLSGIILLSIVLLAFFLCFIFYIYKTTVKKLPWSSILLISALFIGNPLIFMGVFPIKYTMVDLVKVAKADMNPLLSSKDIVIINKFSGLFKKPNYNDLLIIGNLFKNKNKFYIRRVIAKPNDKISVLGETGTFLNGKKLNENYLKENDSNIICQIAFYCGERIINQNSYYVMADNRNASSDSRIWSEVEKKHIKGKVSSVVWPPQNFKSFK